MPIFLLRWERRTLVPQNNFKGGPTGRNRPFHFSVNGKDTANRNYILDHNSDRIPILSSVENSAFKKLNFQKLLNQGLAYKDVIYVNQSADPFRGCRPFGPKKL